MGQQAAGLGVLLDLRRWQKKQLPAGRIQCQRLFRHRCRHFVPRTDSVFSCITSHRQQGSNGATAGASRPRVRGRERVGQRAVSLPVLLPSSTHVHPGPVGSCHLGKFQCYSKRLPVLSCAKPCSSDRGFAGGGCRPWKITGFGTKIKFIFETNQHALDNYVSVC